MSISDVDGICGEQRPRPLFGQTTPTELTVGLDGICEDAACYRLRCPQRGAGLSTSTTVSRCYYSVCYYYYSVCYYYYHGSCQYCCYCYSIAGSGEPTIGLQK